MADFGFGPITVDPPVGPVFTTAPPSAPSVIVVPVAGSRGSQGLPGTPGTPGTKGDPGDKGDKGDAGPAGLNWRMLWDVSTAYAIDDAVYYGGSSYYAVAATTGSAPDPASTSPWMELAVMGQKGNTGDPGSVENDWHDAWQSTVAYPVGAIVQRDGSAWIANTANTGDDPGADFTTNPVGSTASSSPISFGSNNAGAMGFTVDRAEIIYAINTHGIGGFDQSVGLIGIASDIAAVGYTNEINWLGKGPGDGTKVILDAPVYLYPGTTYYLVVTGIGGWMVADNTTVTDSHMTWNGDFFYGNGSVPNTIGIYNFIVILYGSAGAYWDLFAAKGDKGDQGSGSAPGGSAGSVQFDAAGVLGGSTDLTWDESGKVLAVNGNMTQTLPNGGDPIDVSTNSNEFSRFQLTNADAGDNAGSGCLFINDVSDVFQFYQGSSGNSATPHGAMFRSTGVGGFTVCADSGPIAFGSGAAAGSNEHMRITNAGKVGIGTAAPSESLDVVGNVLATGTVAGSNLSGTNTGDQHADGTTITGTGSSGDPFVAHSAGGSSITDNGDGTWTST